MRIFRCAVLFATSALALYSGPSFAETLEQFYTGKTIDLVIGYPPAGSNDVYARTLGRYLGKYIPGHPSIVPKNMPGGGSFLALAYLYNVAPKDGTQIGIGAPTAPLDEKLGSQGVRFKTAQFNWIGRIDLLTNIVFMWHTSPVKTFADAQRMEFEARGDWRRLDGVHLSNGHQQRSGDEIQADHGLQGLERGPACR